jgi:hypothetical protein
MRTFPGESTRKVKPSAKPQKRQSKTPTDKKKKMPFNSSFADLLKNRSG